MKQKKIAPMDDMDGPSPLIPIEQIFLISYEKYYLNNKSIECTIEKRNVLSAYGNICGYQCLLFLCLSILTWDLYIFKLLVSLD